MSAKKSSPNTVNMHLQPISAYYTIVKRYIQNNGKILFISNDYIFCKIFRFATSQLEQEPTELNRGQKKGWFISVREYDIPTIEEAIKNATEPSRRGPTRFVVIIDRGEHEPEEFKEILGFLRNRDPVNTDVIITAPAGENKGEAHAPYELGFDERLQKLASADAIIQMIASLVEPHGKEQSPRVREVRLLLRQGRYEEALKLCDQVLKAFPGKKFPPDILYLRGKAFFGLENKEKSKGCFHLASELAGGVGLWAIKPLQMLLKIYRCEANLTKIHECLKKMDDFNPSDCLRKMEIGFTETAMGNTDEALAYFKEALKVAHAKKQDVQPMISEIVNHTIGSTPEIAMNFVVKMSDDKNMPEDRRIEVINLRGNCFVKNKKYPEAIAEYQKALQIHTEASVYYNMATTYNTMGKNETAMACLGKMITAEEENHEKTPAFWEKNERVCYRIGYIFFEGEKYPEAAIFLKQALAMDPRFVPARKLLAAATAQIAGSDKKKKPSN